jgi:hypothetical protein
VIGEPPSLLGADQDTQTELPHEVPADWLIVGAPGTSEASAGPAPRVALPVPRRRTAVSAARTVRKPLRRR